MPFCPVSCFIVVFTRVVVAIRANTSLVPRQLSLPSPLYFLEDTTPHFTSLHRTRPVIVNHLHFHSLNSSCLPLGDTPGSSSKLSQSNHLLGREERQDRWPRHFPLPSSRVHSSLASSSPPYITNPPTIHNPIPSNPNTQKLQSINTPSNGPGAQTQKTKLKWVYRSKYIKQQMSWSKNRR